MVHPFTAAAWTKAGDLLTVSPAADEPGAAGLFRRYGPDLTLAHTCNMPAAARDLSLDEAGGRLFAVTGSPADDGPAAGLLVAYKLADLAGESARPAATLRTPLRVGGVARSADGKALYAAVGTAVLTLDPATLRQTASVKGEADRVTPSGRPLAKALASAGELALAGDPPRLVRGDTDLTPADGLTAAGFLAVAGDRAVLTAATGSGIELLRLDGDKAVPVAKRADKPPHEFRGLVALSADGKTGGVRVRHRGRAAGSGQVGPFGGPGIRPFQVESDGPAVVEGERHVRQRLTDGQRPPADGEPRPLPSLVEPDAVADRRRGRERRLVRQLQPTGDQVGEGRPLLPRVDIDHQQVDPVIQIAEVSADGLLPPLVAIPVARGHQLDGGDESLAGLHQKGHLRPLEGGEDQFAVGLERVNLRVPVPPVRRRVGPPDGDIRLALRVVHGHHRAGSQVRPGSRPATSAGCRR